MPKTAPQPAKQLPRFAQKLRAALGERDGRLPDGSLSKLAADSGVPRLALRNALTVGHEPDGAVIAKMCEALKVDVGWVLDDSAPVSPVVKQGDDLARAVARAPQLRNVFWCIAHDRVRLEALAKRLRNGRK